MVKVDFEHNSFNNQSNNQTSSETNLTKINNSTVQSSNSNSPTNQNNNNIEELDLISNNNQNKQEKNIFEQIGDGFNSFADNWKKGAKIIGDSFQSGIDDIKKNYDKGIEVIGENFAKTHTFKFLKDTNLIQVEKSFLATRGNILNGLGKGIFNVVEGALDTTAVVGGVLLTPLTGTADLIGYATGNDWGLTNNLWNNNIKPAVEYKIVDNIVDDYYKGHGKIMNDASIDFFKKDNMGYQLSETAGEILGTVAGGKILSGAGATASGGGVVNEGISLTTKMGSTAFAGIKGFGEGVESAWNDGADVLGGLAYGGASGLWDAGQYYLGGKINEFSPIKGDTLLGKIGNIFIRGGIDGAANGIEVPARSLFKSIYNGKSWEENFNDAGGLKETLNQAIIGTGFSLAGEGISAGVENAGKSIQKRKILKEIEKQKESLEINLSNSNTNNNSKGIKGVFDKINNLFNNPNKNYLNWLTAIDNAKYRQVVDGITFISESKEGLDNLLNFYSEVKTNCNESSEYFIKKLDGKGLEIVDIKWKGQKTDGFQYGNKVFIDNSFKRESSQIFFHECGHFLDEYDKYSQEQTVLSIIEQIRKDPNLNNCIDILNNAYSLKLGNVKQELNNNITIIRNQAEDNVKNNIRAFELLPTKYKEQLINDEVKKLKQIYISKHIDKSGYSAILDIFDAITEGKDTRLFGHGAQYFSYTPMQYKEVIANISDLYNNGNIDILYRFLPKEQADSMIDSFEKIIQYDNRKYLFNILKEEMEDNNSQENFIKFLTDYLENHDLQNYKDNYYLNRCFERLTDNDIKKYLNSYDVSQDYLKILFDKYGYDKLSEEIQLYLTNGDINVISDENIRKYISIIEPDKIRMFNILTLEITAELPEITAELPEITAELPEITAELPEITTRLPETTTRLPES